MGDTQMEPLLDLAVGVQLGLWPGPDSALSRCTRSVDQLIKQLINPWLHLAIGPVEEFSSGMCPRSENSWLRLWHALSLGHTSAESGSLVGGHLWSHAHHSKDHFSLEMSGRFSREARVPREWENEPWAWVRVCRHTQV